MTEAEWLACDDPRKMLSWVRQRGRERKFRLFALAFWRWDETRGDPGADEPELGMAAALEFAERWAESSVRPPGYPPGIRGWHPLLAVKAFAAAEWTIRGSPAFGRAWIGPREEAQQATLLREVFPNPFRPPLPLAPAVLTWNDGTVPRIAQGIYDERELPAGTLGTDRLPILADALLDAGCDDEDLLTHLRSPGSHVRGCWALDLILGKS